MLLPFLRPEIVMLEFLGSLLLRCCISRRQIWEGWHPIFWAVFLSGLVSGHFQAFSLGGKLSRCLVVGRSVLVGRGNGSGRCLASDVAALRRSLSCRHMGHFLVTAAWSPPQLPQTDVSSFDSLQSPIRCGPVHLKQCGMAWRKSDEYPYLLQRWQICGVS